jgi:hypothetical protein
MNISALERANEIEISLNILYLIVLFLHRPCNLVIKVLADGPIFPAVSTTKVDFYESS